MLPAETMESIRLAVRAAVDKKAFQLVGLEVAELTSYTDSFLLCSAASDRQVGAIADEVQLRLKESGRQPLHVEGAPRSDWVLLDYGDFIIHVFTEEKRGYYALDSLWGDAPRLDNDALGIVHEGSTDIP
jgi:ribosome-associated protein